MLLFKLKEPLREWLSEKAAAAAAADEFPPAP